MANGNIVKIDKAIKVTFKLGTQTFTEDFLVLIVTTPVLLGNPFFVKHKVSISPGQSYIKFPDQTLQINEIKLEKQPRRVVKRKKFGVYTEIEKPDLDKVKMANGNIVKIDKAIKVTFKLGTKKFTEDFLVLIVTTPVILGNPFFVKHKVSISPGQSYIKFPDQTLKFGVYTQKKFGVYTQKKQVLQPHQQAVLE